MPLSDWTLTSGVEGQDSVEDTTNFIVGTRSFKMPGNNLTNWQTTTPVPIVPGRPYILEALVRASSIASLANVSVNVIWLNSAKGTISGNAVNAATVNATNTWQWIGARVSSPANARWAVVNFGHIAGATFDLWVQSCQLVPDTLSFSAYKSANQNVTGGAGPTKITFNTEAHDSDAGTAQMYDTVGSAAWVRQAGVYRFYSYLLVDIPATAGAGVVQLYRNGGFWRNGTYFTNVAATGFMSVEVEATDSLNVNDYIEVYFAWTGAGTAVVQGGDGDSRFTGERLIV